MPCVHSSSSSSRSVVPGLARPARRPPPGRARRRRAARAACRARRRRPGRRGCCRAAAAAARPSGRPARRSGPARPSSARAGRPWSPGPPAARTARPAGASACRRGRAGPARRGRPRPRSTPDSLAISMLTEPPLTRACAAAGPADGRRAAAARPGPRVVALVGVHDVADQPVPDHVVAGQPREVDVVHAVEDVLDDAQPAGLAGGQVHLGDVAGDHDLGAEAEPGEEHLHLLGRGVLRLVQDDERVVQRPAAHVGQRRDLDGARRDQPRDRVRVEHVVQRVVERPQVRVDLLVQRAGQEAEPLPGLHRRPGQDDPVDLLGLQRLDRLGHGQVGLAGAGRADAEDDRVLVDGVHVALLVERLGPDRPAAGGQDVQASARRPAGRRISGAAWPRPARPRRRSARRRPPAAR